MHPRKFGMITKLSPNINPYNVHNPDTTKLLNANGNERIPFVVFERNTFLIEINGDPNMKIVSVDARYPIYQYKNKGK